MRGNAMSFAALVGIAVSLSGCDADAQREAGATSGGDTHRGAAAISRYGCGSCHTIKGISGANGLVGPPLSGIGSRLYVAGMLPNTPENLEHWVRNPTAVNEKTVMPNLGVTPQDATDIAAFLYSLK
jgi:cytochrome c2